MPNDFRGYQPSLGPGFLKKDYGTAWERAFGAIKDYLGDWTKQGMQQAFPQTAQADALALIGANRGIPQGVNESVSDYVASLINAWSEWQLAGSPWSILGLLQFLGYSNVFLVTGDGDLFGPSGAVVIPNPNQGIAGTPPAVSSSGNPWLFAVGEAFQKAGRQGLPYPAPGIWQATTSFAGGSIITPSRPNGLIYENEGASNTSGSTEPVWPITVGATVADGTITWTCIGSQDVQPIGQSQGTAQPFSSGYLLIFAAPLPSSWTDVVNPPTPSSAPSSFEILTIERLLSNFGAAHATCMGILIETSSDTRATFGYPFGRTFYGDAGMTTADSVNWTTFWLPATTYAIGQQVIPDVPNGHWYYTTTGGTSGETEPSFPTGTGGTVVDGTVTWTCGGATGNYLSNWTFVPVVAFNAQNSD
jgi:hypothetical protein